MKCRKCGKETERRYTDNLEGDLVEVCEECWIGSGKKTLSMIEKGRSK